MQHPGRWRNADTVTTDWDYDLESELERLGANPRIVALYVLLAQAIRDGRMPPDLVKCSNGAGPGLTGA